jgi:hypothetical protein
MSRRCQAQHQAQVLLPGTTVVVEVVLRAHLMLPTSSYESNTVSGSSSDTMADQLLPAVLLLLP